MKKYHLFWSTVILVLFSIPFSRAQTPQEKLLNNFEKTFSVEKEVAYLHLNKNILLQGEQLGISAYVVNKNDLTPAGNTSNLYVQIRNSDGQIIKEEILFVEDGVASSVYDIDDDFLPGDYTITAFTNWMRNFDERNYFIERIKVVSSLEDNTLTRNGSPKKIDAQFLPESGHLLAKVLNHVGVIVKDNFGYGLANATVTIKDDANREIAAVKLNEFGIGKFSFVPSDNGTYKAVVKFNAEEYPVEFKTEVETSGVILSSTQRRSELRIQAITNSETLKNIGNKNFNISIQGRNTIQTYSVNFESRERIPMLLDLTELDPGVNIITLFDEELSPVAERMVFNYTGLPVEKMEKPVILQKEDSLRIKLSFDTSEARDLSISVLPKQTLSYNRNHNIISYNFLQPFLKTEVENAGWYFKDVDNRKKYELDNLLLTQGWSSYDWSNLFDFKTEQRFPKEKFLEFEAQIVDKRLLRRDQRFVVHATSLNSVDQFIIPEGNTKFIYEGFKASEGDTLFMSRVKRNDDLLPAPLSVRFSPDRIPDFRPDVAIIPPSIVKVKNIEALAGSAFENDFMKGFEELDEVNIEVTRDKEQERERRLNQSAFSTASVIRDEDLRAHQTLGQYLSFLNLQVIDEATRFKVISRGEEMVIYLDDSRIYDPSIISNFPLYNVDYVSIDRSGLSNIGRDAQPVLKIYTDRTGRHAALRNRQSIQEFEIPLAYSRKKTFYTPKYQSNSGQFFKEFGVIAWIPNQKSKNGGDISFSIPEPEVEFQLIIEGFTSSGSLIHEVYSFP